MLEVGSRRIAVDIAEDRHDEIGTSGDTHTDGNLFGSGDTFASAGKAIEQALMPYISADKVSEWIGKNMKPYR